MTDVDVFEGDGWLSFVPQFASLLHQLQRIGYQGEYTDTEDRDQLADRLLTTIPMIGRAEDGVRVLLPMLTDAGLTEAARPGVERLQDAFRRVLAAAAVPKGADAQALRQRLDQLYSAAGSARSIVQDLEALWRDRTPVA